MKPIKINTYNVPIEDVGKMFNEDISGTESTTAKLVFDEVWFLQKEWLNGRMPTECLCNERKIKLNADKKILTEAIAAFETKLRRLSNGL